jgi:hypothetical protein
MRADFSMPVTSLDPEKEFQRTIDQIPYLLSDAELKDFQAGIRGVPQSMKNEWAIDELNRLGKISPEKHKQIKFVLNGHPDYPNCLGQPDCYMGIKNVYSQMNGDIKNAMQYADNNIEYFMEKCSPEYLIPTSNASENNTSRSIGGFINYFRSMFTSDEESGSTGTQQ